MVLGAKTLALPHPLMPTNKEVPTTGLVNLACDIIFSVLVDS